MWRSRTSMLVAAVGQLLLRRGAAKTLLMTRRAARFQRFPLTLAVFALFGLWLQRGIGATFVRDATESANFIRWFASAMAMYTFWQLLRIAWTRPDRHQFFNHFEATLLAAAPLTQPERIVCRLARTIVPTAGKASLVCIPLLPDIASLSCAWCALFLAFATLESIRLASVRYLPHAGANTRAYLRIGSAAAVIGLLIFFAATILRGAAAQQTQNLAVLFLDALRTLAASPVVHIASLPWHPFARLLTTTWVDPTTYLMLAVAIAELSVVTLSIFWIDNWTARRQLHRERQILREGCSRHASGRCGRDTSKPRRLQLVSFPFAFGIGVIAARQWIAIRDYLSTVMIVLALPGILSLLPLLVARTDDPIYPSVIGSLLFYTFLLLPPALKIDFRRDIERIDILRALPLSSRRIVIGQVSIPIVLTYLLQILVLGLAAFVRPAEWMPLLIGGIFLLPVTGFIFGLENCLILWFPHRQQQEGIEMFIRTTLTFIGKSLLFVVAVIGLRYWIAGCQAILPQDWVAGAVFASCFLIATGLGLFTLELASIAFRRFQTATDLVAK